MLITCLRVSTPVYVVLLHYPILNRQGEVVATAVTNMDIHDIARTAKTYGAKRYYVVTPIIEQHEIVGRILEHWRSDYSREYHPDRVNALSLVKLASSFEQVKAEVLEESGESPEIVFTDARKMKSQVSFSEFRKNFETQLAKGRTQPLMVVLGTGWGIAPELYKAANHVLEPLYGPGKEEGYNHLSVRAAAAAIMDRLFGL